MRTHFRSVATYGLCVWSSWEPVTSIWSLLEISIACALPYHLSLDFFHWHGKQRSWLAREGELLLFQDPNIREIRKVSYMLGMSKHWLDKCCLAIWRCCLLKKIMVCMEWAKSLSSREWAQGDSKCCPFTAGECVKTASIPLKGYRTKNKYTL